MCLQAMTICPIIYSAAYIWMRLNKCQDWFNHMLGIDQVVGHLALLKCADILHKYAII